MSNRASLASYARAWYNAMAVNKAEHDGLVEHECDKHLHSNCIHGHLTKRARQPPTPRAAHPHTLRRVAFMRLHYASGMKCVQEEMYTME